MCNCKKIYYIRFDTIDSTNSWVKRNADVLDPSQLSCITAQEQIAGRGRWGRTWVSPRKHNIYASLFLCISPNSPFLGNMGQILALSCAQSLQERGFSPQLKWPNDILLDQKKLAGILCETVPIKNLLGVIMGIGINVNMPKDLLDMIDQPAISLAQQSGHPWKIEDILDALLHKFLANFELLQTDGFVPFHSTFEQLLAYKGEVVSIFDGYKTIEGICKGVDEKGYLKLQTALQQELLLLHGEILPTSVRGMYA